MTIKQLKPGMNVYNVGKTKMGNTTIKTVSVWPVHIISVDEQAETVVAKWNHNTPMKFYKRSWSKWRIDPPILIKSGFGHRLATKEESKLIKLQANQG